MNGPVDRDLIEQLLENDSLSFREIGRRAGCSDWTVRRIWRDLADDSRPMKLPPRPRDDSADSLGLAGWGVLAGIVGLFIGAFWFFARGTPPPEI